MLYKKHYTFNGVDTKQVACIELQGKPNAATEGALGVLGIDVTSPTHEVYKCVAVNGSIYTWELLSSGMSVLSATVSRAGVSNATFEYSSLLIPNGCVLKAGDLIVDKGGYLYQLTALGNSSCEAKYTGTQLALNMVARGISKIEVTLSEGRGTVNLDANSLYSITTSAYQSAIMEVKSEGKSGSSMYTLADGTSAMLTYDKDTNELVEYVVENGELVVGGEWSSFRIILHKIGDIYDGEDVVPQPNINDNTLLSTNDTTDRLVEMQAILDEHKYLKLGAGDFYLSGQLKIGDGAVLEGCGAATRIMQTPDSTQPSMIWLKSQGTIKSVCIQGEWDEKSNPPHENGVSSPRIGIVTAYGTHNAMITNCFIRGWTAQGILGTSNSTATYSMLISDCDICYNYVGLKLEETEYACVSHCVFHNNIYGVRNNAGNNKFTACGFDNNVEAFCIDKGYNNGHGSAVGCTFNHNSRRAIQIANNEFGYVFSSCNFADGAIAIHATAKGTLFTGCRFGNWMSYYNYSTSPTRFEGCIFSHSPETESTEFWDYYNGIKFENCTNYNTGESVDNVPGGGVSIATPETWTFTLADGSSITKDVLVGGDEADVEEWLFTLEDGTEVRKAVLVDA